MLSEADEKEWLQWILEGRGELYGCLPTAGDGLSQSESATVNRVGMTPDSD